MVGMMAPKCYQWVIIYTSLYVWCDTTIKKIVHMAVDDI